MAAEHFQKIIASAERAYRSQPVGTDAERIRSLEAGMELALHTEGLARLQRDEVKTFLQGQDEASYQKAVRNVPRGWLAIRCRNAARTELGEMIDLIVAVDPAQSPALQSLIEQHAALLEKVRSAAGR